MISTTHGRRGRDFHTTTENHCFKVEEDFLGAGERLPRIRFFPNAGQSKAVPVAEKGAVVDLGLTCGEPHLN
jgi:hypothetical protein